MKDKKTCFLIIKTEYGFKVFNDIINYNLLCGRIILKTHSPAEALAFKEFMKNDHKIKKYSFQQLKIFRRDENMELIVKFQCDDPDELYYQISTTFSGLYDSIEQVKVSGQLNENKLKIIDNEILNELSLAIKKFPTWPNDPLHALAVVSEEYGELAKEILQFVYESHKTDKEKIRREAIQTIVMILRLIISLDIYNYNCSLQHDQKISD